MPQVEPVRHRRVKPVVWAAGGLVVVVLVVLGVLVLGRPGAPEQKTEEVQLAAREKAFTGDKDEAISLLKDQIEQTSNKDEKVSLYMQLGAVYEFKPEKLKALEAYREADKLADEYGIDEAIARVADALGEKELAIEYYQRNRAMIKAGTAPMADQLEMIEEAIVRLGGKL